MADHDERIEHGPPDPPAPLSGTSREPNPDSPDPTTHRARDENREDANAAASGAVTRNIPAIAGFVSSLVTAVLTLGFLVSGMLPCDNWLEDFIGLPILISPAFWIAGVVLSILGIRASKRSSSPHRNLAVAGIVMTCGAAPLMGLFAIVLALGSFYNCF